MSAELLFRAHNFAAAQLYALPDQYKICNYSHHS